MQNDLDFSDIAPYADEEVASVLQSLSQEQELLDILLVRFPRLDLDGMKEALSNVSSVLAFQEIVMEAATAYFVEKTIDDFSINGLDNLDPNTCYLFISNHWDIALDSALLGWSMFKAWRKTPQIAIGDNLFMNPWLVHLFKLNKTVIVSRSLERRALYQASLHLSHYIHHLVSSGGDSFWIAQAEGRTKDGNDLTQSGLVKMIALAGGKDPVGHLKKLRSVPVTISYEFDPCDVAKSRERMIRTRTGTYEKEDGEDLKSIIRGLEGYKGRAHMEVGKPIDIEPLAEGKTRAEVLDIFREELDRRIMAGFRLWPSHYLACDLLEGNTSRSAYYNRREKEHFQDRLEAKLGGNPDKENIIRYVLELYANPVRNKENQVSEQN